MRLVSISRQLWNYARLKPVTWLEDELVAACRYPRGERDFEVLEARGVRLIVNLHPRAHLAARLQRCGMTELHLPVEDFTPPTMEQLDRGVRAILAETATGAPVAVHCGAGLGRTGTLVACYLVARGRSADDAIARVRSLRPGSIETSDQEAAVRAFAQRYSVT